MSSSEVPTLAPVRAGVVRAPGLSDDPWQRRGVPHRSRRWPWFLLATAVASAGPSGRLVAETGAHNAALVVLALAAGVVGLVASRRSGSGGRRTGLLVGVVAVCALVAAALGSVSEAVFAGVSAVVAASSLLPPRSESPNARGLSAAFVAAAGLAWYLGSGPLRTWGMLALAVATLIAGPRVPLMARLDGGVRRVIDTVFGTWLPNLIVLTVATVFLYIPGAVLSWFRWLRSDPRSVAKSAWVEVRTSPEEQLRDSRYPFAATPRKLRRRRHLLAAAIAVVMVVVVVVLSGAFVSDRSAPPRPVVVGRFADEATTGGPAGGAASRYWVGPSQPDSVLDSESGFRYSQLALFSGVPWADELQAEEALVGEDARGRFVNVIDGVRATRSHGCSECPSARIWLLGGSFAFGIGQRDNYTIASELVRLAEADGLALDIANLAQPGRTVDELANRLEDRLGSTDELPDLVVSIDGFTEVAYYLSTALGKDRAGGAAAAGELVSTRIRRAQDRTLELLEASGIEVRFFLQPHAYRSPTQVPEAASQTDTSAEQLLGSDIAATLDETARRLGPRTGDLGPIFDDVQRPVFFSAVHTVERGASMTAAAMYEELAPLLADLAGR